ncbi:ribosome biogenesis GTP-binding protein YihA/YsxC [Limisalsivibrio acetivorans]|uniref:ribosome biogenesis GTP-binding protein YihA/YsxC n=1 Tax=Limisalsivibrio acetivorans TaxID=1304888 RepID=UPI0003B61D45|nr:ribosome biogenesis GTP-binding protein YihA/YsxC [Limisalsivibrio acetivorans]
MKAEFVKSAVYPVDYPDEGLPEIAFVGRSNVGKSSMMNKLINRKGLVKVSATPGKTKTINFFRIDDHIMLVDLPGYGYARVSKKDRAMWNKAIGAYLEKRGILKACVLILDMRRKPSEEDLDMLQMLADFGISTLIAVTKSDKLSGNQRKKQMAIIAEELELEVEDLFEFSAETGKGKDALWQTLEEIALS